MFDSLITYSFQSIDLICYFPQLISNSCHFRIEGMRILTFFTELLFMFFDRNCDRLNVGGKVIRFANVSVRLAACLSFFEMQCLYTFLTCETCNSLFTFQYTAIARCCSFA